MDNLVVLSAVPLRRRELHDIVSHSDNQITVIQHDVLEIPLGNAHSSHRIPVVHGDDALCHHGIDDRNFQLLRKLCQRLCCMGTNGTVSCQNHRMLCLKDQTSSLFHICHVCQLLMHCGVAHGHDVGIFRNGQLCDVIGQIDVRCTRFLALGILECDPHDLVDGVRTDDLLAALGDGRKHLHQIQELVGGDVHPVGVHLTGDCNQRCAVAVGICHAGDQIGCARPQRGKTDTCLSRQSAIDIRHKCCALFVPCGDKLNGGIPERLHDVQILLSGNPEDIFHAFIFQTPHQQFCCGHSRRILLHHKPSVLFFARLRIDH